MRYAPPYGTPDDSPYINGNPSTGTQGSIPPAEAFENPMRELVNLINLSGGFTPTAADLQQIAKAIQAGKINYSIDTGTADAMIATLLPAPPVYTVGMRIWVRKIGATNATTTPTLNVNGLGPKTIIKRNTTAVGIADLQANGLYEFVYDGVGFRIMSLLLSDVAYLANTFGGIPSNTLVHKAITPGTTLTPTWTVPPGVTRAFVRLWGGGGAGGGHQGGNGHGGSGGGGGGYAEKTVTGLIPGTVINLTIGHGGIGPTGGSNGQDGGTTIFGFGPTLRAFGGKGGLWGSTGTFFPTLTGTIGQNPDNQTSIGEGGDVVMYGGRGQQGGIAWNSQVYGIGGIGGGAPNGGSGGMTTTSGGQIGDTPGGGGGGAGGGTAGSTRGGDGGGGAMIIQWNDPPQVSGLFAALSSEQSERDAYEREANSEDQNEKE